MGMVPSRCRLHDEAEARRGSCRGGACVFAIAAAHPGVLEAHRSRIDALALELSNTAAPAANELDAEAIERLRALGYLETVEDD